MTNKEKSDALAANDGIFRNGSGSVNYASQRADDLETSCADAEELLLACLMDAQKLEDKKAAEKAAEANGEAALPRLYDSSDDET